MMSIGLLLIFLGFFLIFLGVIVLVFLSLRNTRERETNVKAAGVFFIGPIPIVLASDKETARIALYFTIIGIIFFLLIIFIMYH